MLPPSSGDADYYKGEKEKNYKRKSSPSPTSHKGNGIRKKSRKSPVSRFDNAVSLSCYGPCESTDTAGFDMRSDKLRERRKRFRDTSHNRSTPASNSTTKELGNYMGAGVINGGGGRELTELDFERMTVVGTRTVMEKVG